MVMTHFFFSFTSGGGVGLVKVTGWMGTDWDLDADPSRCLFGSVSRMHGSSTQGHELEPHVGCRDSLKVKTVGGGGIEIDTSGPQHYLHHSLAVSLRQVTSPP